MGGRAERRESETESNRLTERGKEHCLEMELAWFKNAVSAMENLSFLFHADQ